MALEVAYLNITDGSKGEVATFTDQVQSYCCGLMYISLGRHDDYEVTTISVKLIPSVAGKSVSVVLQA